MNLTFNQKHRSALVGALIGLSLAAIAFSGALTELVTRWGQQAEYGHGFLIPLIAAWLLWARRDALSAAVGTPSWWGPVLLLIAVAVHFVGELSAIFVLSQLAFVVALGGISLSVGGMPLLRLTALPLSILLFAIPLPYFIEAMLTWRLQIISSQLGTAMIRLFGIPVFLEGNVIDLGNYKLQVVEACSGLRYLYPLLCLSFLAAYLYAAPLWQRTVIFLSAIPITIVMNSLRIAIVGVLVNQWGTQMAEGAIHFFEGWVVFLACAGILFLEIRLFAWLSGYDFWQVFGSPHISSPEPSADTTRRSPVAVGLLLLGATAVLIPFLSSRVEVVPDRARFASFPTVIGTWGGHSAPLDPAVERALGMEDYLLSDFKSSDSPPINLYVAYYESQRKGVSPHSPLVCMPGGGWQIVSFERTDISASPINRAIVEKGGQRQLVYYWFIQRGRKVANEFWSKWYLFADAILQNRTDGALVRVTTPLLPHENETAADGRLRAFVSVMEPHLETYLPATTLLQVGSLQEKMK